MNTVRKQDLPLISVLMCVYNEPIKYITHAIDSIINQTYKKIELIIILDNPKNNNAKSILDQYVQTYNSIHYYVNEKNLGLPQSLNRGLKYCSGELIARIDSDDYAEKNRLENQYYYLNENNLDLVGCEMRRVDENDRTLYSKTNQSYKPETLKKLLLIDDCVAHPSWLLKKEIYEKLKGYRYIKSCEDYDFLLRCIMEGFNIGITPGILMNYRINNNGISRNNALKQFLTMVYLQKNRKRINNIQQNDIDAFLYKKINENDEHKYEDAISQLNCIIDKIKEGSIYETIKIPKLVFQSRFILINVIKIIQMQFIKHEKY